MGTTTLKEIQANGHKLTAKSYVAKRGMGKENPAPKAQEGDDPGIRGVEIVKVISETRRYKGDRPRRGFKRVQAIVRIKGTLYTRHGDTKDGKFLIMKIYKPKGPRCVLFGCHAEGATKTAIGWFCSEEHRLEAAANIARVFVEGGLRVPHNRAVEE